jgi:hypothetical protein
VRRLHATSMNGKLRSLLEWAVFAAVVAVIWVLLPY